MLLSCATPHSNERPTKNATYKANILSLNTMALIMSSVENIVIPGSSPWFQVRRCVLLVFPRWRCCVALTSSSQTSSMSPARTPRCCRTTRWRVTLAYVAVCCLFGFFSVVEFRMCVLTRWRHSYFRFFVFVSGLDRTAHAQRDGTTEDVQHSVRPPEHPERRMRAVLQRVHVSSAEQHASVMRANGAISFPPCFSCIFLSHKTVLTRSAAAQRICCLACPPPHRSSVQARCDCARSSAVSERRRAVSQC